MFGSRSQAKDGLETDGAAKLRTRPNPSYRSRSKCQRQRPGPAKRVGSGLRSQIGPLARRGIPGCLRSAPEHERRQHPINSKQCTAHSVCAVVNHPSRQKGKNLLAAWLSGIPPHWRLRRCAVRIESTAPCSFLLSDSRGDSRGGPPIVNGEIKFRTGPQMMSKSTHPVSTAAWIAAP